jgi:hypothetical protein
MKRRKEELRPEDLALARDLRQRMRDLDPFIPPAPPFEQIERPAASTVRLGRSTQHVPPRVLPVGVLGVVVAFVLIVGWGFFGSRLGPASSTSPSSPGLNSPLASSTGTPNATSTPPPMPTVEPTLALAPGVIFHGSVQSATWSPGGTEIAVTVGGSGDRPYVTILDTAGKQIDRLDAWDFAWVDDRTYVAIDKGAGPAATTNSAFVGHVGSSTREPIPGDFGVLVAGDGGAVALTLNETASNHYRIWSRSGLSAPRDGVPIAFSPDGSLLAVVHYPVACCAGGPSPEPTRAPGPPTLDVAMVDTGASVATNPNVAWAYGAYLAFSPDSRRIAFLMNLKTGPRLEGVGVMDIASRKLWVIAPDPKSEYSFGTPLWTDSEHLILEGPTAPLPAGIPVSVAFSSKYVSSVFSSPVGRTATLPPDSKTVVVGSGSSSKTYDLPDVGNWAEWSPDGSRLLVACGATGNYPVVFDLLVIRP